MVQNRTPSQRNAVVTKQKILTAAVHLFASYGYSATGLRDVAELAEVSLPLVSRYFGSKAGLFEAAMRQSLSTPFLDVPHEKFGKRLVLMICGGSPGINPSSISALSTGDAEAREIATRVIEELVVQPLAKWLGGPQARRRAEAITMLGAGLNTHVHLLPTAKLDQPLDLSDPLLSWFANSFQIIVDGGRRWKDITAPD